MTRRAAFLCALLISAFTATCVYADWQDTRWGQSLEALRASERQLELVVGTAIEDRSIPAYGKPLLSGPYKAGAENFSADYLFHNKKLSAVVLYMSDYEQAVRVSAKLRAQYGRPELDDLDLGPPTYCTTEMRTWRDSERGNLITFRSRYCRNPAVKTSQYLLYTPIVSSTKSGL
ncbi:hypothetical protein RCCGE510_11819 [Rhizobium sp. CCGE 510]|nr:hypothetical protein RCCGE510_11819 [Rhizobium sp. CCGE 510]